MTNPTSTGFTVFFDYTCPFAHRAHRWFDDLSRVSVRWRPFSLLEHNYRGDGPPVWRLPERAGDISLLLFAGHSWVAAEHGDLARYGHDVFHTWHETDTDLEDHDIVAMANDAGAAGGPEELRAHFVDAESDHDDARRLGIFGSPTLVFAPDEAVFVNLDRPPPAERAHEVLDAVRASARLASVREIEWPTPPGQPGTQS